MVRVDVFIIINKFFFVNFIFLGLRVYVIVKVYRFFVVIVLIIFFIVFVVRNYRKF